MNEGVDAGACSEHGSNQTDDLLGLAISQDSVSVCVQFFQLLMILVFESTLLICFPHFRLDSQISVDCDGTNALSRGDTDAGC